MLGEIRAGRLAPVYLLHGEESFFIDKLTEALQATVPEEARDFDFSVYYGADNPTDEVIGDLRRFPLMAEKHLVMYKEVQSAHMAKNQLSKIAEALKAPVPSTVLVITWKGEALGATADIVKAVKKLGGVSLASNKLKEYELGPYITDYCQSARVKIDRKAADMLKDYVGADLTRLSHDIDKLVVAGGGQPITPELIEKNLGVSKDFNNFELVKAISMRNYGQCIRIVDYFERNPKQNPVIMTEAVLFRFFTHMMLAYYAPDKSERGLMDYLGFRSPYQLTDLKQAMPRYTANAVFRILHALRVMDVKAKGGSNQKDTDLLREFIYQVFTLR